MPVEGFTVDPFAYVSGVEAERARRSLRVYFASFSGRRFESLSAESDPWRFTAHDVLAARMLAVNPKPQAIAWLLYDAPEELTDLLASIPVDATILESPNLVRPAGVGERLWGLLRSRPGVKRFGLVTTSKLLASKRPALFPIKDEVVVGSLTGFRPSDVMNWWALWADRLSEPDAKQLWKSAVDLATTAAPEYEVTPLRVLDIAIWMRDHGWTQAPEELRASLADFELPLGTTA